jgi:hypothetical protein
MDSARIGAIPFFAGVPEAELATVASFTLDDA